MFTCRIVARQRAARTITVAVRFVPRALVEPVERLATTAGITRPVLAASEAAGTPSEILRPIPSHGRARRSPARRFLVTGVAGLCLTLILWAVLAERRLAREARIAETQASRIRQIAVERTTEAREAEIGVSPAAREAFALRRRRPLAIGVLEALTEALDDEVVLDSMSLTPEDVEISGEADIATGLIADLEAAATFDAPSFTAPVRRDSENGRDQFRLRMAVRGEPDAGAQE